MGEKSGDLISTILYLFLSSQSLHKDDCQNCIDDLEEGKKALIDDIHLPLSRAGKFIYVNECQSHRHCRCPNGLIFQVPRHFVNTSIAEGMSRDSITTFNWQRLTKSEIIVRPICSATSNLSSCYKKRGNQLLQQIINWRLTDFSLSYFLWQPSQVKSSGSIMLMIDISTYHRNFCSPVVYERDEWAENTEKYISQQTLWWAFTFDFYKKHLRAFYEWNYNFASVPNP